MRMGCTNKCLLEIQTLPKILLNLVRNYIWERMAIILSQMYISTVLIKDSSKIMDKRKVSRGSNSEDFLGYGRYIVPMNVSFKFTQPDFESICYQGHGFES